MAAAKAIVLSASIDNEQAIRDWLQQVGDRSREVGDALDRLSEELRNGPHISITLHQS